MKENKVWAGANLKHKSVVYNSSGWYTTALGGTRRHREQKAWPMPTHRHKPSSVCTLCTVQMGMLEMKVLASSKKVKRHIQAHHLHSFPLLIPPLRGEQQAPCCFPCPCRRAGTSPATPSPCRSSLNPPAWTAPGSGAAVSLLLWPFEALIQTTVVAAAIFWLTAAGLSELRGGFVQLSEGFICVGFWGFFLHYWSFFIPFFFFLCQALECVSTTKKSITLCKHMVSSSQGDHCRPNITNRPDLFRFKFI